MATDVGPGTRLLCISEPVGWPIDPIIRSGSIYTCREVMDPRDGLIGHCLLHGPSCTAGAVLLEGVHLIDPEDGQEVLFSLCRFVPIGGDLPEEITRQLDVTPTHTPELVPA